MGRNSRPLASSKRRSSGWCTSRVPAPHRQRLGSHKILKMSSIPLSCGFLSQRVLQASHFRFEKFRKSCRSAVNSSYSFPDQIESLLSKANHQELSDLRQGESLGSTLCRKDYGSHVISSRESDHLRQMTVPPVGYLYIVVSGLTWKFATR